MSFITTHILDTTLGAPARGVEVELEYLGAQWSTIGKGATDNDGRVKTLVSDTSASAGTYRLRFHTGEYFARDGRATFYPYVEVVFEVASVEEHYHVPLLLNAFGYSTYRGS
jgi:5-hydroxyisourate hydrolase